VRAVFFGSSDSVFSNRHFRALQGSDCEIAAVVDVPPERRASTNPSKQRADTFVQAAGRGGIPSFEPGKPNSSPFIAQMLGLEPDLFVAVGYMLLLGPRLLSVPRVAAANFHASLLPAYRGKHPVFWALRNGEQWCGLTVHEMSKGLDTGAIIYQVRVPVNPSDSVSSLYERIMDQSVLLVPRLVAAARQGTLPRTPQPEEGASCFGATTDEDFRITWSMEAAQIARWVRATPGQCYVEIRGTRLFLLDAAVTEAAPGACPGTVLELAAGRCRISAGHCAESAGYRGAVEICRVRTADGRETSAAEALAELGAADGSALGAALGGK
jgi:methionyl-tRNA formyltransferase